MKKLQGARPNADGIGAMVEELRTRLSLILEAASGFNRRLDTFREEILGQFVEVGSQIRFLSEQIAENRDGIDQMHTDLGAEMVRISEALGQTRVEFRERIEEIRNPPSSAGQPGKRRAAEATALSEVKRAAAALKREIASSFDHAMQRFSREIRHTDKALSNLAHKFDRFDDRLTVRTKDQDQRLKKLERRVAR